MPDLLVFTPKFDFGPDKMHFLRDSCAHFGVELQTYGEGPWPGYIKGKITHAIPFLESREEKYVLFCDASDTMMIRSPTDLVGRFLSFGRPVVISAERDCFPLRDLAPKFQPAESGYTFPNAGGFMGERDAVIAALGYMDKAYEDGEDQARWIRLALENPSSVAIDSWCSIFQTMSGGAAGDVEFGLGLASNGPGTGRVVKVVQNKRTGTNPYFLHFNGRTAGIEETYAKFCG